ncbi:putative porin [Haliea sp.]|uniref:putative porin n=1 Tax=Haliea sp. TaxID=1932666 RepID=UPI0035273D85
MNRLSLGVAVAAASITLYSPVSALAAVSEAEFAQLQAQMAGLMARVAALEEENATLRENTANAVSEIRLTREAVAAAPSRAATGLNSETFKFSGDFRYRYEEIDIGQRVVRTRHRVRARAGFVAQLPRDVQVGLKVAAGNDSPVSGNATLGGGGTSKELYLDQAWATWQPFDGAYATIGKMKNPMYRPEGSGLLWDSDYTPEGIALGWANEHLFVNAVAHALESDSARANNVFYYGVQSGFTLALGDNLGLTAGGGYIDMPVKGKNTYFGAFDVFFGNSFSCDTILLTFCTYDNNYEELELFATLDIDGLGLPAAVYGHFAQNLDADDEDTAWSAGARLGKASGAGSWQVSYEFASIEADSLLALLSDSNIGGGGTDVRGHKLGAVFAVDKQWHVGLTLFVDNETLGSRFDDPIDYDRVIFDTSFKY